MLKIGCLRLGEVGHACNPSTEAVALQVQGQPGLSQHLVSKTTKKYTYKKPPEDWEPFSKVLEKKSIEPIFCLCRANLAMSTISVTNFFVRVHFSLRL
jgi:N6-adenosine-specific RNA methylase IME4